MIDDTAISLSGGEMNASDMAVALARATWYCPALTDAQMREAIDAFRIERQSEDLQLSDAQFFAPLLEQWQSIVCAEECDGYELVRHDEKEVVRLSSRFVQDCAVAMNESMAMRDALLLSVVSSLSWDDLMLVATAPSQSQTAQLVASTLAQVFHSPQARPDIRKTLLAQKALESIQAAVPEPLNAQASAILSYIAWWAGRGADALTFAHTAIDIDPDCTLPAIIIRAVEHDVQPAWQRAEPNEESAQEEGAQ